MLQLIKDLLHLLRDPGPIIQLGYPVLMLVIFAETGAMIFFLPGDSLLVVAGLYAAKGDLNIVLLNLLLIPCAILGDAASYWMGAKAGPRLFSRPRSRVFRPEHVVAAQNFYDRHGGKAIILARFMPLVRTFVPVVAGIAKMPYRRFAMFNIVGGASWILTMTFLGYFLAGTFPGIAKRIEIVILVIVFLSITPGLLSWWKSRRPPAKE